eukprot:TRINITY_DN9619_c0_g1_i1.p1 TRINITY_DN9619_c0_g1~~TRINITY_DN9619_c0_g1_i1.p1  ORF type:complete len:314 (+),score=29.74 TRINITY_DN9619_c0_g1_i1:662-1603(+)
MCDCSAYKAYQADKKQPAKKDESVPVIPFAELPEEYQNLVMDERMAVPFKNMSVAVCKTIHPQTKMVISLEALWVNLRAKRKLMTAFIRAHGAPHSIVVNLSTHAALVAAARSEFASLCSQGRTEHWAPGSELPFSRDLLMNASVTDLLRIICSTNIPEDNLEFDEAILSRIEHFCMDHVLPIDLIKSVHTFHFSTVIGSLSTASMNAGNVLPEAFARLPNIDVGGPATSAGRKVVRPTPKPTIIQLPTSHSTQMVVRNSVCLPASVHAFGIDCHTHWSFCSRPTNCRCGAGFHRPPRKETASGTSERVRQRR